ncbi:MAG TPA: hypothetical protein ACFYEM_08485, partial [Candidatus Hypogeohydataceae bacterium YC40]
GNKLNLRFKGVSNNYTNNSNYGVINGNGYQYPYNQNNISANNNNYGTSYSWTSLSGSCGANSHAIYAGNPVTWTAGAVGGNGYYTYSWSGTDGLVSNEKNPSKTYYITSGIWHKV